MMYRLFVLKNQDWQELDLPNDFGLSLVQNSVFLGQKQAGSFSFSSTLRTTASNCRILQNAHNPQMVVDRKIQYPAKLMYGSTEYYSWYFVLRRANDTQYSYDLIQTPGNQPRQFYDLKLWQLNFGKLELQSTPAQSKIWTIDLYGASRLYERILGVLPTYFEIVINGIVVVKPIVGMQNDDSLQYWYTENDPEKRFLLLTKNITTYFITLNIPKTGVASINVISNSNPITSVSIKTYEITITTFINRGALIATHNLTNLGYDDVSESLNTIAQNQKDYPFKFLTYFNDSFYPADNAQYEGIVNKYTEEGNLQQNDAFQNLVAFPISPCFSLSFILEKIAAMMGFELQADVFQSKALSGEYYLGDLHLINNVDFAKQIAGTDIPCNVYDKTILYSNFMPDWTVKEFIDAIRTTFCLSINYDYENAKIIVVKGKEILNNEKVIDISDKLTRMPSAEIIDKTYYQLRFKNADNTALSHQNYPTDDSIADDGRNYTPIEAGFTPVINNTDIDQFLSYDPNPNIPTVNETARSVIYLEQKNNHPTPRISFFLGTGSNGLSYVGKSDNRNAKIRLSWTSTATHKGLLEMFYQEYLDFLNSTTQWTTEIWLKELELAYFDFSAKYYAYGTVFLVETLSPKLPVKTATPIKLLSL